MNEINVKSGKEILNDFFENLNSIDNIDISIANCLRVLYSNGKLSDKNIANELQRLRELNDDKN